MMEVRPIDANELKEKLLNLPGGYAQSFAGKAVIAEIAAAPILDYAPRQQWISVKDRLPEFYKSVLVYDEDGCMFVYTIESNCGVLYWSDDYCNCEPFSTVTHWMPLPEPPKGDA